MASGVHGGSSRSLLFTHHGDEKEEGFRPPAGWWPRKLQGSDEAPMRIRLLMQPGCICGFVVIAILLAGLWWSEPYTEGVAVASSFPNKLEGRPLALEVDGGHSAMDGKQALFLPPAGRGGEGRRRCCLFFLSAAGWWFVFLLHSRATHMAALIVAMIFGQYGGPSSTSKMEAFYWILYRSSSARPLQVVRPRRVRVDRLQWSAAGAEALSNFLSDLGVPSAWRSTAAGGGGIRELDCVSSFYFGCVFVTAKPLSSNTRFLRRVLQKGFGEKLYLPRVLPC